jgi:acyl dehydratase
LNADPREAARGEDRARVPQDHPAGAGRIARTHRREIGATAEPWCYEATRDNIRHYAHGIGDDNPLWCEPDYAAKTRHGGIIALPSFLFATSRIISGYVGGLPGVHAMWSGADWNWHQPIIAMTRSRPRPISRT